MELNDKEIVSIVNRYGYSKVLKWSTEDYADDLIGFLGDHLRLKIEVEQEESDTRNHLQLMFFVKCMPRFDKWKANYLNEMLFFKKEYIMLSQLFKNFADDDCCKWRPKLLFIKEDLFVFEDVTQMGYKMANNCDTLTYEEILAVIETMAKFHAQSYIHEAKRSKELDRPYRIWEDFSGYLKDSPAAQSWRDAGKNAVIDFLKAYSKHRDTPNFSRSIEVVIPMLFSGALELMKPNSLYRNAVIHRDLWSNNIFFKSNEEGKIHALIVDFQTVVYSSPMLDLSSLLFFNTTRDFRTKYTESIVNSYHKSLSQELTSAGLDVGQIIEEDTLMEAYDESVMFGITQAALIVPIVAMEKVKQKQFYSNPKTYARMSTVSRSQEFIQTAREDEKYRVRVTELLDDIVERYLNKTT